MLNARLRAMDGMIRHMKPRCSKQRNPAKRDKREAIPLGEWFPIAAEVRHTCCRCGFKHTFHYRIQMKVTP